MLAALATMRQRLMRVDGAYTADQAQRRLNVISSMRDYVRTGDADCFADYCQRNLAGPMGDMMVDMLEELYEELGLKYSDTWDLFEALFLTAKETV
jgi:site-specific recombinase